MSTSLLYHAFGLRGYDYVKTDYQGGAARFAIRQRPRTYRCPACNSRQVRPRGTQRRAFKAVPIGGKPVCVTLPIPRVECPSCKVVRQVGAADLRRSPTRLHARL
jgi:transposase